MLINNAGLMTSRRSLTSDGIEKQLAINYLGHYYLTRLLLSSLCKSDRPRICNLASMAYNNVLHTGSTAEVCLDFENMNWQQPGIAYNPDMAYSRSKLAIVLSTVQWAEVL